jgi:hypothetical protein
MMKRLNSNPKAHVGFRPFIVVTENYGHDCATNLKPQWKLAFEMKHPYA